MEIFHWWCVSYSIVSLYFLIKLLFGQRKKNRGMISSLKNTNIPRVWTCALCNRTTDEAICCYNYLENKYCAACMGKCEERGRN